MSTNKSQLTITLNFKTLFFALLALFTLTVAVMLYMWQPWSPSPDRTITVTGQAVVESEPDQYIFSPSYEITAPDKSTAISEASDKSASVVEGLKQLGVEDKDIKLFGYNDRYFEDSTGNHATVNLNVTVHDKDLAQKVQDYLLGTNPDGQITPAVSFSQAKQEELEATARSQAIADAKAKGETSAGELGVKLGKVVRVSEGQNFDIYPVAYDEVTVSGSSAPTSKPSASLPLQPGQNEYRYSVTVVFEIK